MPLAIRRVLAVALPDTTRRTGLAKWGPAVVALCYAIEIAVLWRLIYAQLRAQGILSGTAAPRGNLHAAGCAAALHRIGRSPASDPAALSEI